MFSAADVLWPGERKMKLLRFGTAFIAAALTTVILASVFYTYRILDEQALIGAIYTPAQSVQTYIENLLGLAPTYGAAVTLGLLVAFGIAAVLKRIATPLAPIAYPLAGAAALFAIVWMIENLTVAKGGAGVVGGARGLVGISLQMVAGFVGGTVFAVLRPK